MFAGARPARGDRIVRRGRRVAWASVREDGDGKIIRDLVLGKRRYADFISSPENIASNILSDRLKRLEAAGLVSRRVYQQKPVRYEYVLTEKGNDLKPILEAISRWGKKHCPGTDVFHPGDQPALRVSKTGSTNSDFNN